jgi:uncharacterized protein (TIGR03663 family)
MNRGRALGLLLVLAACALALRLPDAGGRPLHNDEAVNATKLATLLTEGRYAYEPHEYHGPTLHYFALPLLWLTGARTADDLTDYRLRLVTIGFGVACVLAAGLFARGLGWPATLAAAALTAVSPAMVFYSRYFIHEMLLVVFTALLLGAGWRWWLTRKLPWALLAGAGLGLMYATKETFLIPLLAIGLALAATALWGKWVPVPGAPLVRPRVSQHWRKPLGLALAVAAVVGTLFFTSFFTHARGPLDSVLTYAPWFERAGGASPHLQPWHFYFERLFWFHPPRSPVWSEALVGVLALVGAGTALAGRGLAGADARLARFLTFYSFAVICGYTLIAYKTPWCLLGFWQPMLLLAGLGVAVLFGLPLFHTPRRKLIVAIPLLAATIQLAWQGWRLNHEFAADRRNPYTYSQTVPEARELIERVLGLARVHPAGDRMLVKIIAGESYWPLPWYFRDLEQTGWYDALPEDPFAPVVLASTRVGAALDEKSGRKWIMAGMYGLRPGVFLELYVDFELWQRYVATLPKSED